MAHACGASHLETDVGGFHGPRGSEIAKATETHLKDKMKEKVADSGSV